MVNYTPVTKTFIDRCFDDSVEKGSQLFREKISEFQNKHNIKNSYDFIKGEWKSLNNK